MKIDACYKVHSIERSHAGVVKSDQLLKERYYGITKDAVRIFIRYCFICNLTKVQRSQSRIKCIKSSHLHERGQLDLIEMSPTPCVHLDIEYKRIAHYEDHFMKFHVLWAQPKKEMVYVVDGLESRGFAYFGVPVLLQTDNGKEFKNHLMVSLLNNWEGYVTHIFGGPRHPQSQGLVEQANGTVQLMLNSMMVQFQTDNWVKLLPKCMFNLNTQVSSCKLIIIN